MSDNPIDNPTDWIDTLAGDNTEIREQLSNFDSKDAFLSDYTSAKNADWRDGIAGEDEKFKSTLERFKSPGDFGNAFREAQQTIRSGQFKQPPGEDATPEQIASFREANNIPQEAAGYLENLPDGLVLGDEDKELFTDFLGAIHEVNADPAIAHKAVEWYNGFKEKEQDYLASTDAAQHQETEDQLRQEWGGDYRQNINLVGAFLEKTFGAEVKEVLMDARGPDGRAIMNHIGVLQGLADQARATLHPMQLAGQSAGDAMKATDDEIAEIEKVMRENRAAYNKDEAMQARLRDLYEIRSKHAA